MSKFKTCKQKNCKEKHHAKGECQKHYMRRYEQSPKGKEIRRRYSQSPKGKEAIRRYQRKYYKNKYQTDPVFRKKMKRANRKGGKFKDEN